MWEGGEGFDFIEIGADKLRVVDGARLVNCVHNSRKLEVDAVESFCGDDGRIVDAADGATDDLVVFGVLEFHGLEIGRRKGGGLLRERAVGESAFGGLVDHAARGSCAFGFGHGPGLRGGGDEHLAAGGAYAAERIPVDGRGGAATGALRAIFGFIEVGLFDADIAPVDVEFVGDNHGQGGFYALANLTILAHAGHDAVRRGAAEVH